MHSPGQSGTEQQEVETPSWRDAIVGASPAMLPVLDLIGRIAERRTTVLISGETGCGKEVVARAIHLASKRAAFPFVAVNCAAIPKDLLETELFGYVPGAFATATRIRLGQFEQAEGGTLFLDEIGDMALETQAKLLRVLQEREIQRVGSSDSVKLDVRVLAATNVDLMKRVKQGRFREDLYYRLHVAPLRVPALRERTGDIPLLADHFTKKIAVREGLGRKTLTAEAMARLTEYSWPGNVRELENAIEVAMVTSENRTELQPQDFPIREEERVDPIEINADQLVTLPEEGLDFEAVIGRIEYNLLNQALLRSNGNKKMAAQILRLKRTTLAAKLKAFGYPEQIDPDLENAPR